MGACLGKSERSLFARLLDKKAAGWGMSLSRVAKSVASDRNCQCKLGFNSVWVLDGGCGALWWLRSHSSNDELWPTYMARSMAAAAAAEAPMRIGRHNSGLPSSIIAATSGIPPFLVYRCRRALCRRESLED